MNQKAALAKSVLNEGSNCMKIQFHGKVLIKLGKGIKLTGVGAWDILDWVGMLLCLVGGALRFLNCI